MTYGLWYPRNHNFQLIAYSDADWANCVDERKSTSGGAFFLGDSLVAWISKKQGYISLSTAYEEYIAAATFCTQILWMIQTLTDLKVNYTDPITIMLACFQTEAEYACFSLMAMSLMEKINTFNRAMMAWKWKDQQ
jgi:hypothetical protein